MNNITQHPDRNIIYSPKTYFHLIHKVGSNGKYQNIIFWIFFLNCFITSLLLMSTSFIFLNPEINCGQLNLKETTCQEFFCSLPEHKRQKYLEIEINSLAVQFGPFHCEKKSFLNLLRMSLYLGAMFGYVLIPFVTDNYGRKTSMITSWTLTLFGIFILSVSFNISMASFGLFFAGFGCQSGIRTIMTIMGEIVEDDNRQKQSTLFSISFGIGQIFIGLIFFLIKDWRHFTITCCLVPGIIQLILLVFYLEETPKFLLKRNKNLAVQDLNRIAQVNGLQKDTITLSDVESVINENVVQEEQIRTPLALLKFQSQRWNFILMSLIFFSLTILYYGPMIIIQKLNMNIYISQFVLGTSEVLAYFVCYLFINKLPRKLSGYRFLGLATIFFFALVFFSPPQNCQNCLSAKFQLMFVFTARFCLCFYMAVFFLYITEIFPLPLRGTGFGMVSLWGAVASTGSQFILITLADKKHNPMVLFTILSATTCMYLYPLPETLGRKLQQHIPEEESERKTSKKIISEKTTSL